MVSLFQYLLSFNSEKVLPFLFLENRHKTVAYLKCFSVLILSWNGKWLASVAEMKTTTAKISGSYESRLISYGFIVNVKPYRIKEKDCTINS